MSFNSRDFKGFTFRSGPVKNQVKQNSTFWDTNSNDVDVDEFLGLDTNVSKGKDLVALAGYKRAISNFVNIVTEDNIPVVFNSNDQSYTDGKKVVIGSNIDDKKFDVAVGLALHEGSHIKLSDFNLLRHLETSIPQELYELAEKINVDRYTVISTVKSILNYVEDRRIDSFIFRTSPGYKNYYHAMYDKYFYSKNVDKGLLSSEYRTEEIDSYMFRIINLHNKNRQLTALKGLKEIYETIDLGRIQRGLMKDTNEAFNVACDVMSLVLLNIDPIVVKDDSDDSQDSDSDSQNGDSQEGNGSGDSKTISDEELQDMLDSDSVAPSENLSNDDGSDSVELSDRQKKMLDNHFKKQEKFLDGDVQKTKLTKKESTDIQSIDESGATYENVGKDVPKYSWDGSSVGNGTKCLVVRKLTQSLIDSDQFSCCSSWNQRNYNDSDYNKYNFVSEGLRLGSMLGRKLQVRGEESQLKFSRQDSGKIDKRLIAELGFGNSNVFSHTLTERFNKAYLHLSVDASGSMNGKKWNKAMTSAVAMIKACDMAGNIDVVMTIRTTHSGSRGYRTGGSDVPMIMVCYDSRVDKLQKVKSLFSALQVSGTTPEGLCFEAIEKDLIPGNSNQDSYFINFSDGQPYYGNSDIQYSGDRAEAHTKKMCDGMRAKGISVLSYFITDYDVSDDDYDVKAFKKMYGKDAEFIKPTNMMAVAKTMNKKFLSK